MFYLFQLGRQPEISTAEIKAVFTTQKHKSIKTKKQKSNNYLIADFEINFDAQKIINRLGGTIKIAKGINSISVRTNQLINQLTDYLINTQPSGKIEFSLNNPKLALEVKKDLKRQGRSARYIEPKNTATILFNKLVDKKTDLTIIDNNVFVTEAIQPFEQFSERDYGRPQSDDKSGMLPPKLAKIMINLAVETQNLASLQDIKNTTILDPFCGSGTILTEAASMGYKNLIGSDISAKAIENTRKNLKWIIQQYNNITMEQWGKIKLFVIDSTKLSTLIPASSIDRIITEPYLGKPLRGNESIQYLQKQAQELSQLYIDSFKSFHKILKPDGVAVFIIPRFKTNSQNEWVGVKCVEEITTATARSRPHGGKKNGFEILPFDKQPNLLYHRPKQRLAREIWRFKKIF